MAGVAGARERARAGFVSLAKMSDNQPSAAAALRQEDEERGEGEREEKTLKDSLARVCVGYG